MFKKTVLAVSVAAVCSTAFAAAEIQDQTFSTDIELLTQDVNYTATSAIGGTPGFYANSTGEAQTYQGHLKVTNTANTAKVTGLYANGSALTNAGTIDVTSQKSWQNRAMMAQHGGTAVNAGTINATEAYGMTVGSSESGEVNTIINDETGLIVVASGVGMEAGGAGATAVVTNKGTIDVRNPVEGSASQFSLGILVKGSYDGEIVNSRIITATAGTAAIQVEENDDAAHPTDFNHITNWGLIDAAEGAYAIRVTGGNDLTIDLAKGSVTNGMVQLGGTGTVLNAVAAKGTLIFTDNEDDSVTQGVNIAAGSEFTFKGEGSIGKLWVADSELNYTDGLFYEITDEAYTVFKDEFLAENGYALPSYYDKKDVGYILGGLEADKLVIDRGTLTNEGVITGGELVIYEGGRLITGYSLANGNSIAFDAVTVNTGGALQLTNLNSAENTSILIEDGVYTFDGGKLLQADGTEYHGALKVGRSKSFGAEIAFDQGDYSYSSITLAANKTTPDPKAKLTVGSAGTLTVGTLDAATGDVAVSGKLTVTDSLLNAYYQGVSSEYVMTGSIEVKTGGTLTTTTDALTLSVSEDGAVVSALPTDGEGNIRHNVNYFQTGTIVNNGTIELNFGEGFTLSNSSLVSLKNAVMTSDSTGVINVGDASLEDLTNGGKISFADLNAVEDGITTNALQQAEVTDVNAAVTGSKSVGSLVLSEGEDALTIGGGTDADMVILNGEGSIAKTADGENADVNVANHAVLVTTGDDAVLGNVSGEGMLNVSGAKLTINGNAEVDVIDANRTLIVNGSTTASYLNAEESVELNGDASIGNLTVGSSDGRSAGTLNVGQNEEGKTFKLEVENLTVTAGSALSAGDTTVGAGTILGTASFGDLTVGDVLHVGSEATAGKLTAQTLKSGRLFLDPVFDETGTMAWGNASQVSVTGIDAGAGVEVGNASLLAVGATNEQAVAAMNASGYRLSNDGQVGSVKAAAYVAAHVDGSVWVTGADAPTSGLANGAYIGSDGLVVVKSDAFAGTNDTVFTGAVVNDGSIYLADFNIGDTIDLGDSYAGDGTIDIIGDRMTGAFADEATGIVTIEFDDSAMEEMQGLVAANALKGFYTDAAGMGESRSAQWVRGLMSSALTNEEVVAQMNAAAGLGVTAGLQAVTLDASDAFAGSVAKRTGILTDFGEGVAIWADVTGGRYQAKKLFDGAGYASDIYAGVFGADYTAPCGGTLGAAITFGTADTDSKNTIASTSADSDYWGFSVYGAKAFGNAKIAADFGYMAFSNDVSAGLGIGRFSADTDAVTFGVRGEYLYEAGDFRIVPHAGLRYTHLATDGFEAAFRTDVDSLNVWRMPIGVTVSGNVETNGWKLAPSVDLTVVPALGDKDADVRVGIAGTSASDTLSMRVIDAAPVQAAFGLTAEKGEWTFGASWQLGVGGHDRFNNAFTASAQYRF